MKSKTIIVIAEIKINPITGKKKITGIRFPDAAISKLTDKDFIQNK